VPRRLLWLGILIGAGVLAAWAGPHIRSSAGPVLLAIVGLIALTGFWWLTMWVLLGGRITWTELFPAALATSIFWIGMEVVFAFTFSGIVTGNEAKYGPIGVVFALTTWLVAVGVVVLLGAVVGVVWRERKLSLAGPIRERSQPTPTEPR
jgi:membrane protein